MPKNDWKVIEGFDSYEVNSEGLVRSWRKKKRTWRNPDNQPGRRETPLPLSGTVTKRGYVAFILRDQQGKPCRKLAHRLVALAFLGPPPSPEHSDVAHNDGNPSNNQVGNLRWSTHRDNQMDMRRHGTMQDGPKSNTAKISKEDVLAIRRAVINGPRGTQRRMAEKYGLSPATVHRIVHKKRWKWL